MNHSIILTQEAFDRLLSWLDPDRERAAVKYENIRSRLIKIFSARGCFDPEGLADDTINRVAAKVQEVAGDYSGDPALYFYGVAHKLYLEYLRSTSKRSSLNEVAETMRLRRLRDEPYDLDFLDQILTDCLKRLQEKDRNLLLRYYAQHELPAKNRRRVAKELGLTAVGLRKRAQRLRAIVQHCMISTLEAYR